MAGDALPPSVESIDAQPHDGDAGTSSIKGAAGRDGPVSRRLNRPLSRQLSERVWRWPLTADHWSYIAFGTVSAGAVAFALGRPRAGALLAHAGSVLDGVDGEVARLQGAASPAGALLDVSLDRSSDVALLAGLALGAGGRRIDWLLAMVAANAATTASVVKERAAAEGIAPARLQEAEAREGPAAAIGGRDGRLLAVAIAGMLRSPRMALAWLAVSGTVRLVARLGTARAMLATQGGDAADR